MEVLSFTPYVNDLNISILSQAELNSGSQIYGQICINMNELKMQSLMFEWMSCIFSIS